MEEATLESFKYRRENNIKRDIKEVEFECLDLIHLDKDTDQ
jgi:hypothetical protein